MVPLDVVRVKETQVLHEEGPVVTLDVIVRVVEDNGKLTSKGRIVDFGEILEQDVEHLVPLLGDNEFEVQYHPNHKEDAEHQEVEVEEDKVREIHGLGSYLDLDEGVRDLPFVEEQDDDVRRDLDQHDEVPEPVLGRAQVEIKNPENLEIVVDDVKEVVALVRERC